MVRIIINTPAPYKSPAPYNANAARKSPKLYKIRRRFPNKEIEWRRKLNLVIGQAGIWVHTIQIVVYSKKAKLARSHLLELGILRNRDKEFVDFHRYDVRDCRTT